jgi:hypothetical protein
MPSPLPIHQHASQAPSPPASNGRFDRSGHFSRRSSLRRVYDVSKCKEGKDRRFRAVSVSTRFDPFIR